jgi:minor extracellular serine protease Vpr
MKRRSFVVLTTMALLVSLAGTTMAASDPQPAQIVPADPGANTARLVILFEGESVAAAVGAAHGPEADAHRAVLAEHRAEFLAWMRSAVPQARTVWVYDTVLNGISVDLRGASPAALAAGPNVAAVMHPRWMEPVMNASLPLIGWETATGANFTHEGVAVGEGIKVGIIDTGIDPSHPFFAVTEANADFYTTDGTTCIHDPQGEVEFTNCKVFVSRVFHPDPDATAEALHPHGNHVAGTVAGNSGTVDPDTGIVLSGIAPAAFLGNYNVFPGEDPESASTDDIAMAVEAAVLDGMDLLNLSLGGTAPRRGWDVLELALQVAANVGVLSAVAAGNTGPGAGTIESPGRSPWVITAGASTNPHFLGQSASHGILGDTGAAVGDFDAFPDPAISADFVWWGDVDRRGIDLACRAAPRGTDLSGQIALIARGECTFTTKIRNAEDVGAIGVVIFNNAAGDPVAMGHDGTDPFPTIPAVMVSQDYGKALVEHSGTELTVGGPISEQDGIADIIAGFSSRGPASTPDGLIIKPDLAAPGVNVYSAVLGGEFAMNQGTSMASPHLAGAAAALLWHREWTEPQRVIWVKSLIANSAVRVVLDHVNAAVLVGVNHQGNGRLQLDAAWDLDLFADPVSVSFGQVRGTSASASTTLSGDTQGAAVESVVTFGPSGVVVTAEIADDVLVISATWPRGVRGDFEGYVEVAADGGTIRVPFWARIG